MVQFLGRSFRIFQSGNFTMLNQGPRTGLDARGASSIYIKTAFLSLLQSYLNRDSEHIIQDEFFRQRLIKFIIKMIGPDVQNKFTLILLNKNPKIYESIIRIGDWSQPYDFSKRHDASISQTLNCISPCLIKTCQNLLVVTQT